MAPDDRKFKWQARALQAVPTAAEDALTLFSTPLLYSRMRSSTAAARWCGGSTFQNSAVGMSSAIAHAAEVACEASAPGSTSAGVVTAISSSPVAPDGIVSLN